MWGFALGSLVVLGSQFIFFRRTIGDPHGAEPQPSRGEIRGEMERMCRYGMPLATWGILTWVQSSADRWSLQALRSAREVGLYQVLYQLGYYPILLASTSFLQLVTPIFFAQAGDGSDIWRSRRSVQLNLLLVWACIGITVLGTLLALLFHGAIISLFAAPAYRAVSSLLPLMVFSGGCFAAGQTASVVLMTAGNTTALILPKVATALWGVCLSVAGAALGGITGSLLAGCIFSLTYLIWMVCLMRRAGAAGPVLGGLSAGRTVSGE
jgi:O-antigen/teichoic acid export membrane protein